MTKKQSLELKGIAILFMFLLHLFNTYQYQNIYEPFILINNTPLTFYISLYADICVAIFLFISGYGLFYKFTKNADNRAEYIKSLLPGLKGLMINYWIILVVFCLVLGPLFGYKSRYPGSFETLLLNITAIKTSYCGAWWFLTTYLLLVFTSSWLFKVINKKNISIILSLLAISYFIGYVQRIKNIINFDNPILHWGTTELALYGNSLLPFALGAIFVRYDLFNLISTHVNKIVSGWKLRVIVVLCLILLVILKSCLPSLFFAGLFFIATIVLYLLFNPIGKISIFLKYIGSHSTNLWLTHMFIYMTFAQFHEFVYWSENPILILLSLLAICLCFSYFIDVLIKIFNLKNLAMICNYSR